MRGLSYVDLGQRYEVDLCLEGCFRRNHSRGFVDEFRVLHWRDRGVTRAGLRRFLMLVRVAQGLTLGVFKKRPPASVLTAKTIYASSIFAYATALHDLGIRFPASLAQTDKARVRQLLVGAPPELRRSRMGRWAGLR